MPRKRQANTEATTATAAKGGEPKRKRTAAKDKENTPPGTLSDVAKFFEHAKNLDASKPLEAFHELKNAVLCGHFDKLHGSLDGKSESELRMYKRFATDLPEMSTCCVCDGGRYAIWKDDPESEDILIVHIDEEEHFPSIQVVGDRMEHMLCHLAGKNTAVLSRLLPPECDPSKLQEEAKRVVRDRKKKKVGELPTGVGIWVPVNKDGLGYRSLGDTPADVKRWLVTVGTSKVEKEKEKAMEKIMETFAYVQFANDECDFGMGLEFGHWLMLANYPALNSLAKKVLKMAYTLLDRDDYAEIVEEHFERLRSSSQ